MLIWKLCSLQTFARAFLKHLQRLPWNVTFLVQMAECAATAGGFSAKPTLHDPDYLMCVYQHSTDILKALFSFLVDVRLYWTCVDAKQTARIYLVKKYKFVKRLSTTCFTMEGKGLYIIVSLYSIAAWWLGYQRHCKLPKKWLNVVLSNIKLFLY